MTFKELSFKKKIEHIFEYYFLQILGGFALICGVIIFINSTFINPSKSCYNGVAFYGTFVGGETLASMEDSFTEKYVPDELKKRNKVFCNSYFKDPSDPTVELYNFEKFSAQFMTQEINLIITTDEYLSDFISEGYAKNLELFFSEEEIKGYDEDSRLYYQTINYNGEEITKPFAITINDSSIIKDNNIYEGFEGNIYMLFANNDKNYETTLKIAKEFLK